MSARGPFANSLQSRVRTEAARTGKSAQQIRRELVHQRILARVFDPAGDPNNWILRGGTGILMRIPTARPTRDIDLRHSSSSEGETLTALREALERPSADPFIFRITKTRSMLGEEHPGLRISVGAYVGTQLMENSSLDVIYDVAAPDAEVVDAEPALVMEGIGAPPRVRLYPVPDQIADKVCAMYGKYGSRSDLPSTRYHDLVDIVLLVESCEVPIEVTVQRVRDESLRRGLVLPQSLVSPGRDWPRGYAGSAASASLRRELRNLDVALEVAGAVLNPILVAVAVGRGDGRFTRSR